MIPKSLHTVTVLVQLSRHLYVKRHDDTITIQHCLFKALEILGYIGTSDEHGLTLAALKKLNK
jgi:hypothetical protein